MVNILTRFDIHSLNKIRLKIYLFWFICCSGLLLLTGCSSTFVVKVEGNLGNSVLFQFYKSETDTEMAKFMITEVVVQQQISDKDWIVIWQINGEQRLDSVEYGRQYSNLSEMQSAKSLTETTNYRILVSSKSISGPNKFSGTVFSFNADGLLNQEARYIDND